MPEYWPDDLQFVGTDDADISTVVDTPSDVTLPANPGQENAADEFAPTQVIPTLVEAGPAEVCSSVSWMTPPSGQARHVAEVFLSLARRIGDVSIGS
eukprot:9731609-Karenia_brevis.AAC.1